MEVSKILYGDSFELDKTIEPKSADLILEDMPYNTTACDWDKEPIDLKRYWESRMELIKPTGVICLTASQPFSAELLVSNKKIFKYELIWEKDKPSNFMLAKKQILKYHENILVFYNGQATYNPIKFDIGKISNIGGSAKKLKAGGYTGNAQIEKTIPVETNRYPKSILKFNTPKSNDADNKCLHPTQKPVGLFEYLIRTYTNEGDLVFDGFGGSGTTAIAAHRTKRNFIVIEKDKRYFEIASKRLSQATRKYELF